MRAEYKKLLTEYPKVVSKEQLCQICHISKRKAAWLLENGLIPCSDTGKKTRRFSIRMKDIVFYLEDREAHPEHYITPKGIFTSGYKGRYVERQSLINRKNYKDFVCFMKQQLREEKDMMTLSEAKELMQTEGLGTYIRRGKLKAYQYRGRYIVMKKDLVDSYLRAVRENRNCYRRFHREMVGRYFARQEPEQAEEIACEMGMQG